MRKHHLGNASSKWLKVARVIHFLMFPEYKNVTFIHSLPSPSLPPPPHLILVIILLWCFELFQTNFASMVWVYI